MKLPTVLIETEIVKPSLAVWIVFFILYHLCYLGFGRLLDQIKKTEIVT